jgi:LCP family protein required for cell wall assembly
MVSPSPNLAPSRGLPRWLKAGIITVLVLANLTALGMFWALSTGQDVLAQANTDHEVVTELSEPVGESLVFLLVGSDSRQGLDDLTNFGSAGGERGDVIMLVNLDKSTGKASMLSIPRDLWVDIPGHGQDKINSAYGFGGPGLLVQTIRENLGIEVNHYVEVGFVGFIDMIDELGGIELDFPYPARDVSSGLDVEAGTQIVDGETALAFARSRKYQQLEDGQWVSVDADDIGRTQRQQEVVRAILAELKTPASIVEAGDIAGSLARHVTIDASLASSSIASMAWDFRALLTGSVDGETLPVYGDSVGGASIVRASEPEASDVIGRFTGGQVADSAPLRVQVLNGNGVSGAAGAMSAALEEAGFDIVGVGDAQSKDFAVTTVVVPEGSTFGDRILARIGFGVVEFGKVDNEYDALVIVGADAD